MSDQKKALDRLLPQLRELITRARDTAARTVNTLQVMTNFEIGRIIVEQEQHGEERAEYGKKLLKELSSALSQEFGRGFSKSNLEYMRRFYLLYRDRIPEIAQTVSGQWALPGKSQTASGQRAPSKKTPSRSAPSLLSWSHYLFLMGVKDLDERSFYEIEAAKEGWSLRELRRQFDSSLYERLALSRDKDAIADLAKEGQVVTRPEQLLKNPYLLEFLGLREETHYSE